MICAECTLNALKQAKRFHATAAFDTDTIGLKKAKEVVAQYKPMMKDFPIDDLLTAAEVSKISEAVKAIFTHLKRTKNAYYPINRYLQLVEAISRDLCSKVLSILRTKRLMHMSYADFDRVTGDCKQVFAVWEDEFESFRDSIREIAKKRNKEKIPLKINAENRQLQERIDEVRKFRQQHEELHGVVSRVLPSGVAGPGGINPSKEIHEAYQLVIQLDVLDLSPEGAEAWRAGVKKYEVRHLITARSSLSALPHDTGSYGSLFSFSLLCRGGSIAWRRTSRTSSATGSPRPRTPARCSACSASSTPSSSARACARPSSSTRPN
jgi:dynein heavy chain 1